MNEAIKQFLKQELLDDDPSIQIGDDDNLLMTEIVDSLGAMRLVGFIEDQWDVQIPPEDVTIENFVSVNAIVRYLEGRLQ